MALQYQPFADVPQLDELKRDLSTNVNLPERIGSALAGAALVAVGLRARSFPGIIVALLGGGLIHRGATGHCALYDQLGVNSRKLQTESGVPGNKGIKVVHELTINRPRQEVYSFWRKLENLPQFMDHLESVTVLDQRRSLWKAKAPAGRTVEWTAEIINEREGELIAWQSLPGSEVQNAGSVWFEDTGTGSTLVKVSLEYQPPGGAVGAFVARMLGESPETQLAHDLRRFRELLEQHAGPAQIA